MDHRRRNTPLLQAIYRSLSTWYIDVYRLLAYLVALACMRPCQYLCLVQYYHKRFLLLELLVVCLAPYSRAELAGQLNSMRPHGPISSFWTMGSWHLK